MKGMNMLVETYEVDEVNVEHPECTDESLRLMEQLELKGQLTLVKKPEPDSLVKSFPYRKMTKDEVTVYGILCPAKTPLKDYADSQIPLRVLQVAALAKEHFQHLLVLHPEAMEKDPVLVGSNDAHPLYAPSSWFILARWGEELDAWPLLVEKACKAYSKRLVADVNEKLARLRILAETVKGGVSEAFLLKHAGGNVSMYGPGL
jgi:hypothetical protein